MILSYLSHKKMVMKNSGIKVIATSSPIVYRDVVQSFQGKKDMLLSSDDDYNQLNIIKDFDFIADINTKRKLKIYQKICLYFPW